jgi:CBS-domain-containing membrane protein
MMVTGSWEVLARDVMRRCVATLSLGDSVSRARRLTRLFRAPAFPVLHQGRLIGVAITRDLPSRGTIDAFVHRSFIEVSPQMPMREVRRQARAYHVDVAAVVRHGVVDGVILLR